MALAPAPAHPRRLVFLGTPSFAADPLRSLAGAGFDVALVVSQPDKRRGRGGRLAPSPVKQAALALGLPVSDRVDDAVDAGADLGVVVAFGRLIKPHVLERLPLVNVHFSLLPRWRGAAPVERAILAGDERTGVDLMVVEEGLDTGAVYDRAEVAIGPDETAEDLRARLTTLGTELLLRNLTNGLPEPRVQEGEPTYADKIDPAELQIDWRRPRAEIHRLVRIGGAWTTHRGRRLKVWRTALGTPDGETAPEGLAVPAGDGPLQLLEVQPEGRRRVPARAWANGVHWGPGDRLGT
ncbi:MAG TPA: methionyl-tRNA formyltransferase [Acidimicrobiales bacterium]|nr:methionyl-tRNA formyltransferase [Acidimicrobiales bacterium]